MSERERQRDTLAQELAAQQDDFKALARIGAEMAAVDTALAAAEESWLALTAELESLGHGASPVAVARIYDGLIDALVLDRADTGLAGEVERLGVRAAVTDTIMRDRKARDALARTALEAAGVRA